MHKLITATVLGLITLVPAAAGAATAEQHHLELQELKAQLELLIDKVGRLERQNAELQAAAGAADGGPADRVEAIEQRLAGVEQAGRAQAGQIAQAEERAGRVDWASRLRWHGDFRYRHEQFDIENTSSDRVRHRIRARLGMDATISDTLKAGFRIATGDISDPRSGNATLDDASQHKEIALDRAYVDWSAFDGAVVTVGKQKRPWFEAGNSLFYDDDVNPEGVALTWAGASGAFANAWGFWLEESSSQADSNLIGAQLGYAFDRTGLTLAAGYWDYGAIRKQPVLNFSGSPAGNSTYSANGNCVGSGATPCYLHDFDIAALDLQWSGKVGSLPLMLFGAWLQNGDPDDLDTGYNLGFQLGQARDAGSWQFGAMYQDVERDAQLGALLDADFAGGVTQSRGMQLHGVWVPVRNVNLKATLFLNEVDYDTASEFDYKRLQIDMNYKF